MRNRQLLAVVLVLAVASNTQAGLVTFGGTGANAQSPGITLSATASFDIVGGNLVVTLTNTGSYDSVRPTDILTAVFFDLSGNPTLGRQSGFLAPGSSVRNPSTGNGTGPNPGEIGGEWAYVRTNFPGGLGGEAGLDPVTQKQGIGSTGFGIFGPGDRFPGDNLDGPLAPNGIPYGITTAFDTAANDNGGIANLPLIKHSAMFTLSGLPSGFDPATDVSNVRFQYGTDLDEGPQFSGVLVVPEPSALMLSLLGISGLGCARFIRRRLGRDRAAADPAS